MLLPALNKAGERAKTIKCMSNLKQTGTMFVFYAGDNNNWTPCAYMMNTIKNIYRTWPQNLQIYGYASNQEYEKESVFVCPYIHLSTSAAPIKRMDWPGRKREAFIISFPDSSSAMIVFQEE